MEKSLPLTTWYDQDGGQQAPLEKRTETTGEYETRLIPHISLPQRNQPANPGKRSGLLSFASQGTAEPREDSSLTMALDKYQIAQSILAAQQVQSASTLASISATFADTSKDPHTRDQQAQKLHEPALPESMRRLVISPPNRPRHSAEREIEQAQARIIMKSFVTVTLFVSIGGVVWTFFSHTVIYLLILFAILAIMLGSILSNAISDYYQVGINRMKTSLHLPAVPAPEISDLLHKVHEPGLPMKSDTSGYLHALHALKESPRTDPIDRAFL